MSAPACPEVGTAAGRAVELLIALDLVPALREAQRARAETARLLAFLRSAAAEGADPERVAARARALLQDLGADL